MQLSLQSITYTYPSSAEPILRDVSVVFPQGWTGLLGDNGCGKTTLAKNRVRTAEAASWIGDRPFCFFAVLSGDGSCA